MYMLYFIFLLRGLKDGIGTSSYAFFRPNDTDPIIAGSAVESQPHTTASSTRQELLGQLAVEYWLQKLQKEWGTPRKRSTMLLPYFRYGWLIIK